MQTLLVDPGIITVCIVAHLHVDIVIIYSVKYILQFTSDNFIYIYIKTFVWSVLPVDGYISQNMLEQFQYTYKQVLRKRINLITQGD